MKKKVFNSNSQFILQCIFILFIGVLQSYAQETLTLEEAVKIALENNYDIKLSKNNLKIDETNVAIGNAGMLPKVTALALDNNTHQNLSQTRTDGIVNSLDNAKNSNWNYGVSLDWTIFDGFKMFAKLDQLKALQKLGETELKQAILSKISAIHSTYFSLAEQQQQLAALDSTIVISNQRLNLTKNRYSIGKASKLEVLNAEVDLNTDTSTLLKEKELYTNTKILLNQILARKSAIDFKVSDEISVNNNLVLPELWDLASKQNPQLELLIVNKQISELQLKQIKGNRYPTVKVNTGYSFAETRSQLGFTSQTSANGLNYGISASLNLFDGWAQNRNEKIAKIDIDNTKIAIEQQKQNLDSQLATVFQTYSTSLLLMELEEKNEAIAKQNLDITFDKFKIGTINTLEFRTAQLNYVNAKVRNNNAKFQAKLSEISLKELAGNLSF